MKLENLNATFEKNKKLLQYAFIFTCIVGLMAHGFAYTNLMLGHDSNTLYYNSNGIYNGRYFGAMINGLFMYYMQLPYLAGLFELFFLSITTWLLCKFFELNNKWQVLGVAILVIANPVIIAFNIYGHDVVKNVVGICLAVAAPYITKRYKYGFLPAFICIVCAIATYQAFFAISIVLYISDILLECIQGKKATLQIIKKGLGYAFLLVLAMAAYMLLWELLLYLFKEQKTNYLGMDTVGSNSLTQMIKIIPASFVDISNSISKSYIARRYYLKFAILLANTAGIVTVLYKSKNKGLPFLLLALALLAILPIAMNLAYIMSLAQTNYALVKYSFVMVSVLLFYLLLQNKHKLSKCIAYFLVVSMFVSNIYGANEAYVKKAIIYRNQNLVMADIINTIHMDENYTSDKKIAFYGFQLSREISEGFVWSRELVGSALNTGFSYTDSILTAFRLAFPNENFIQMDFDPNDTSLAAQPRYPDYGYVQLKDDVYIVKMSDLVIP